MDELGIKENHLNPLVVVVPAAGVGKRMNASCPKQYLAINNITVLEHTVTRLLSHASIEHVIIVLGEDDEYFPDTNLYHHKKISTVTGGNERVDSVLAGLKSIDTAEFSWVLVHDAARPCVSLKDIGELINRCFSENVGGLLASPVRDTMKRSLLKQGSVNIPANKQATKPATKPATKQVSETVDRNNLWHALTPQMYPVAQLITAIEKAKSNSIEITDESSAIEYCNLASILVEASSDNIKITRPDDLALAEFILNKQAAQLIAIENHQGQLIN